MKRGKLLNEKERLSWLQILLIAFATMLILLSLVQLWFTAHFFGVEVDGSSMEQTLQNGDFLYVQYDSNPSRGDVVIISVSEENKVRDGIEGDYLIKRLIGKEGDTIYCMGGTVYRKQEGESEFSPLDEEYVYGVTADFEERTLREGEIFFLGDNREVSLDSRRLGRYDMTDIQGSVSEWVIRDKEALAEDWLCGTVIGWLKGLFKEIF